MISKFGSNKNITDVCQIISIWAHVKRNIDAISRLNQITKECLAFRGCKQRNHTRIKNLYFFIFQMSGG